MRKKLLIFLFATLCMQKTFGQITSTPLNINGLQEFPVFLSAPAHDNLWAGFYGFDGTSNFNSKRYAHTSDAGATWAINSIPDTVDRGIQNCFAYNDSTAWFCLDDQNAVNPPALWNTTDGGANWTNQTDTLFTGGFINFVYFFSADSGIVTGDPNGGYFEIYLTSDGGATWTRVSQANIPAPLANEYGINGLYSAIGDNIWFSTYLGRCFHSADRGNTWTVSLINSAWQFPAIQFSDQNNGVSWRLNVAGNAPVYVTNDGGQSWSAQVLTPAIRVYDADKIDNIPGKFIFTAGTPVKLYHTTDNFVTYTLIDQSHTFESTITMYDATIGWAASTNADSAMYKMENIVSGIQELPDATNINALTVFPNPVISGTALISFNLEKKSGVIISLNDLTGKLISRQCIQGVKGQNDFVFDFKTIADGVYMINLNVGNSSMQYKLVIE